MTPVQQEAREAYLEHGSVHAAARALGKDRRAVARALKRAGFDPARRGESPEHDINRPVPDFLKMSGLSDMRRNEDGLPVWYKFSEDKEKLAEAMRAVIQGLREDIPPADPEPLVLEDLEGDLANLFVLTDYHIGSRAWPEETRGEAWDSKIAEDLLYRWFEKAIIQAPRAKTAILGQLGDFLDHDGLVPVTPISGHVMDADSRYQLMCRIAIRVLRRIIRLLLQRHENVVVILAEGNHDQSGSAWLRESFADKYENEPRVFVDTSPDPYYCYEHGLTSLFFHHGHLKRPRAGIDAVFAAKFREIFGRTQFSEAHMGHLHHTDIKETTLMRVEQHRTLAARNAHESRGGWISGRDAKVITYSKRFGRVGEVVLSAERATS